MSEGAQAGFGGGVGKIARRVLDETLRLPEAPPL